MQSPFFHRKDGDGTGGFGVNPEEMLQPATSLRKVCAHASEPARPRIAEEVERFLA
jgi:hypothetical protein